MVLQILTLNPVNDYYTWDPTDYLTYIHRDRHRQDKTHRDSNIDYLSLKLLFSKGVIPQDQLPDKKEHIVAHM